MSRLVYDLSVTEDRKALHGQRKAAVTRASRVVEAAFDDLNLHYRIGRQHIARVLGMRQLRVPSTYADLRHDLGLGFVTLREAIAAREVGTPILRVDGFRTRISLDAVPDGAFETKIDWPAVIEYVAARGWTYQEFGRLADCEPSQISRLSRGASLPKFALGESALWAARQVRDSRVVPPPLPGSKPY